MLARLEIHLRETWAGGVGVKEEVRLAKVLIVAVVVTFIFVGRPLPSMYPVQELVTFLLGIAMLLVLILAIVVGLLLSWRGIKVVLVHLKTATTRVASVRARPLRAGEATHRAGP